MALEAGATLDNGRFRIMRPIGRGGHGHVYQAQDTLLGGPVAIKELIPGLVRDEATLRRFLAEAKATMRLTHERIVRTHHVFPSGGNYYIVMEYMAGGSLRDAIPVGRPMETGSLSYATAAAASRSGRSSPTAPTCANSPRAATPTCTPPGRRTVS